MEQICKVDIFGTVGVCEENVVCGNRVVRMSVAVNNDFSGHVITDWYRLVWWPDKNDTRTFGRGDSIHAEGRIAQIKYAKADGSEGVSYEIKVRKIW